MHRIAKNRTVGFCDCIIAELKLKLNISQISLVPYNPGRFKSPRVPPASTHTMRTTTTTTRAVEPNAPHLDIGTVVDVIGGVYEGHIGRVRRYTAHRVVISLYFGFGQAAGSKKTKNKEATIKPSNIKARKLETEVDDESSIKPSNIESTSDYESVLLLAGLVALQIKKQQPDCSTRIIKNSFLKWVKEQSI